MNLVSGRIAKGYCLLSDRDGVRFTFDTRIRGVPVLVAASIVI